MLIVYCLGIIACVSIGYVFGMRIWNRVRANQRLDDDDVDYRLVDEEFYKDWPEAFESWTTPVTDDTDDTTEPPAAIQTYEKARKTQKRLQEKTKAKPRKKTGSKKPKTVTKRKKA